MQVVVGRRLDDLEKAKDIADADGIQPLGGVMTLEKGDALLATPHGAEVARRAHGDERGRSANGLDDLVLPVLPRPQVLFVLPARDRNAEALGEREVETCAEPLDPLRVISVGIAEEQVVLLRRNVTHGTIS